MLILFIFLSFLVLNLFFSFSSPKYLKVLEDIKKEKLLNILYIAKLRSFNNKVCLTIENGKILVDNKTYYFENISSNFEEICFENGKPNLQGSIYYRNIKVSINYAGVFNIYFVGE